MKNRVGDIIKLLQSYNEDDVIFCMWWDSTLNYIDKDISKDIWEEAVDMIKDYDVELASSMIWDTIAEKLLEIEQRKSSSGN